MSQPSHQKSRFSSGSFFALSQSDEISETSNKTTLKIDDESTTPDQHCPLRQNINQWAIVVISYEASVMTKTLRDSSKRFGIALAFGLSVAGSIATATPAMAISSIPLLYGTGVSSTGETTTKPTGAAGTDVNWSVIQYPSNAGSPPTAATIPSNTPAPWIGSGSGATTDDNNGATIDGITYRWISASTSASALSASVPGNNESGGVANFNYILSQTFTVTNPGAYLVNLYITADNRTNFYINGTINAGGTLNPGITGGTLIGSSDSAAGNLGRVARISNWVYLNAGTNTAYMVVNDTGSFTGVLASNVSFSQDVPGPLPLLGASAAFGWSRRLRRRIKDGTAAN